MNAPHPLQTEMRTAVPSSSTEEADGVNLLEYWDIVYDTTIFVRESVSAVVTTLFEAVFENVEDDAARAIRKAIKGHKDPWEKAIAGLRAFLSVCQTPEYRRVVIQEGPAVLGYERFREQEERSTFGIVQDIVAAVLTSYELEPSMVETFSRVFFGATVTVADEDDNHRTLTLVGDDEADAGKGLIGWNAPLARALRGAAVGDLRRVTLPGGEREYEVIAVTYP